MTEHNDETLLSYWYRHQNAQAFRVLATRHAPMVYATALRVLRNPQDAEDVSQVSFLTLAQTKCPPRSNVAAWLHRTAYRAALELIRARDRRIARDRRYAEAQPAVTCANWDDIRGLVDEAVASLPDAYREPVVRYFLEAQTHAEIARDTGITRQAVAQRIGRGIEQVRVRLARKGVVAPAGLGLASLLLEHARASVPPGTVGELERIALAATPSPWAPVLMFSSGSAMKAVVAVALAGTVALGAARYGTDGRGEAPVEPRRSSGTVSRVDPLESPGVVQSSRLPGMPVKGLTSAAVASVHPPEAPADPSLASLGGIVTHPDGTPLAEGKVALVRAPVAGSAETAFEFTLTELGHFIQHDLPPGTYRVYVTEPGKRSFGKVDELQQVTLAEGEHRHDLRLVIGKLGNLSLSGAVVDHNGRPLPGAIVMSGTVKFAATTDTHGRFTLQGLSDGEIEISAHKRGFSLDSATARPGGEEPQLVLLADGAIEGRVIDRESRVPLTDFEVCYATGRHATFRESMAGFWRKPEPEYAHGKIEFIKGAYQIESVPCGPVTVIVRAPGYAPVLKVVEVVPGETLRAIEIELDQSATVTLAGRVIDEAGAPIPDARVCLNDIPAPNERYRARAVFADDAGRFEFQDAPRDMPYLSAWHPDYAPARAAVTKDTTISLRKAGRLDVEVLARGEPVPKASVSSYCDGDQHLGYSASATTDASGRATLSEIIPGRVRVRVDVAGERDQFALLDVAAGESKTLRFDLPPAEAQVEGYLYQNGKPLPDGIVRLFIETGPGAECLEARSGPDGYFLFPEAPAGRAQLVASPGSLVQSTFMDDIPLRAGEMTTLSVEMRAERKVTGTISGIHPGERASVTILRGAMAFDEARDAAEDTWYQPDVAGVGGAGEDGLFESTLLDPGTYTLLVATRPEDDSGNKVYHESRVVQVRGDGDPHADFALRY